MSDWDLLNKHRISEGPFASDITCGFNGAFYLVVCNERVKVICSDGGGWQHVSVSRVNDPKRCPTWDMMCAVKDLFWSPDDCVVQFHPPKDQYVNYHPGCLHLWRCIDGREQPMPPSHFVGPR